MRRVLVRMCQCEHARLAERRTLICRPIGNPARVKPHGTLIVGMPYTLNGSVLRIMPSSSGGFASAAAIATGGAIDVGVTSTSTCSK